MTKFKLLLDTNVVLDCLQAREPNYEQSCMVLVLGRYGEFDLWITTSQVTDLIYVLSNGGNKSKMHSVLERLQGLRTFVNLHPTGVGEVDTTLTTTWKDPEDALLYEAAKNIGVDAIVTENVEDFEESLIPAMTCSQLFDWMEKDFGVTYEDLDF